jgi:hypothetical protein
MVVRDRATATPKKQQGDSPAATPPADNVSTSKPVLKKNPPSNDRPDLFRQHNIQRYAHVQGDSPFEELFKQIGDLGAVRFHEYKAVADLEGQSKPWKRQIYRHAARIALKADRLSYDGGINEDTWRGEFEHRVFERFREETVWYFHPSCFTST